MEYVLIDERVIFRPNIDFCLPPLSPKFDWDGVLDHFDHAEFKYNMNFYPLVLMKICRLSSFIDPQIGL